MAEIGEKRLSFAHIEIDGNDVPLDVPFEVVLLAEAEGGDIEVDWSGLSDFSTRLVSNTQRVSARGVRHELHYVFIARRSGELVIPAIPVVVGEEKLTTQEINLRVLEPQPSDALALDVSLSKDRCNVGEPLELTISWQINVDPQQIYSVDMEIPLLDDKRFDVFDRAMEIDASDREAMGLPVGNRRVIARITRDKNGGIESSALAFSKVIVPRQTGLIEIEQGSVYCSLIVDPSKQGRQKNKYPGYFNNNFFKRDIEGPFRRCYAMSESLRLDVKALPEADRPAGFYGLVGASIAVSASAAPLQVEVGAPITIEVSMHAREYIECLELRPLQEQMAFASGFAISRQQAPFVYRDGKKVFTHSLRPLRTEIDSIGGIEVPYFDTDRGRYAVARSNPIPITIRGEGQVESDLGVSLGPAQDDGLPGFHFVGTAIAFSVGVGVGMGLFAVMARTRNGARRGSPDISANAKFDRMMGAIANNEEALENAHDVVYEALRAYLGAKLGIPPHTLVCSDAIRRLKSMGIDPPLLERLEQVYTECEMTRFGKCYANGRALDRVVLRDLAVTCTADINRYLDSPGESGRHAHSVNPPPNAMNG